MPTSSARKLAICASYCVAVAAVSACATKPSALEPRIVPLVREIEIPVFIVEGQPWIIVGDRNGVPEEGARETTNVLPQEQKKPKTASENMSEALAGSKYLGVVLAPVLVPLIIAARIGEAHERAELRRKAVTNREKEEQLEQLLATPVTRRLGEALTDAFKTTLGWTRPNLTVRPQFVKWSGPEAEAVHTVNLPALEVSIEQIQFVEPSEAQPMLVMCARASVVGGTEYRMFKACQQESWGALEFSTPGQQEALVEKLTGASRRLGQAMAKHVVPK